jgi:N-acetyl-anhydromuramyl-L-alanine amidase AmpD
MRKIAKIIIHHTASGRDITTVAMIDAWHQVRWPDFKSSLGFFVGYHYVIGKDFVTQTRSDQEDGAHTYGFNDDSIGICLTGNFETETPSQFQLDELRKLVLRLLGQYGLQEKDIYCHRDLTATACPGKNLTKELLHNLFAIAPTPVPAPLSPDKQKLNSFLTELQNLINRYRSG